MSFDNPRALFFLALLLPLIVIQALTRRKTRGVLPGMDKAAAAGFALRRFLADASFLVFAGCLVLALAGPSWGRRTVAEYRSGVDLVLALDLSRSMEVEDCPAAGGTGAVSRLDRGLALAREIAAGSGGPRVAAAAGKSRAVLVLPLTWDKAAALTFLDAVRDFSLTGRGTNLANLVDAAAGAFQDDSPARRCILLITDGESHSGSLNAALERAWKKGVQVSFAAVGSEEGGVVPGLDGKTVSRRQGDFLKDLAERRGGVYVDGNRDDAAALLSRAFRFPASGESVLMRRQEPAPRRRLFVLAALLALGFSRALGLSFKAGVRRPFPAPALALALALPLLLATCRGADGKLLIMQGNFFSSRGMYPEAIASYMKALERPEAAAYGEYGLGTAYAALGEKEAALERYRAAEEQARDGEVRGELLYRLRYNSGVLHFEKGEYEEAAAAFRAALEIDGGRQEAKRNLELSLLAGDAPQPPEAAEEEEAKTAKRGEGGEDGAAAALFGYLRVKEEEQWRSREWGESGDYSGPDY
jgi:Ca-activated chloride channel family protein